MRYRRRLRSRIIISFLVLGTGLTALFALSAIYLRDRLENQLIGDALAGNLDDYANSFYIDPSVGGVPFEKIGGITYSKRRLANVPFEWQSLPNGVHDIQGSPGGAREGRYKLAVRKDSEYWFFLWYDITQETLSQRNLIIALGFAVVAFSLLALLLGWWSSRRIMQPVSDLAARLEAFGKGAQPERLAPHFADDEVGQLAAALDDYSERLTELVRRDREFNADVSHELRTPLQVIRGASELLLAQPDMSEKARLRLQRIERAVQQSTDLISSLLMLSRNERGGGATDLRRIAEQQVEAHRVQLGSTGVVLRAEGETSALVDAPEAVVAVAMANLIGNACKYTKEGEIVVRVEPSRVRIEDTGPGLSEEDARRLFERGYRGSGAGGTKGAGIGLAIVQRLCDLYGWRVSIAPRAERGAVATLDFAPQRRVSPS
jgi:signal transduction histidine kinase